jgi:dTDP-4-amino-4,6-dideoxygalactose transaminase
MTKATILPFVNATPSERVLVTQPYVPALDKYMMYVERAFDNKWLTNGGPLLEELTQRLKAFLGVEHLLIVNNGTTALQLAYRLKGLSGKKAITTPYTFPATSTALEWNNTEILLADIEPDTWNLSAKSTAKVAANNDIEAIVPVNIFGMPCDMEAFDELGKELNVPIIYDSAQALLSQYKGKSIFEYGDIHCVSFHATKLFHCVEGGALIFKDGDDYERAKNLINFGIGDRGQVLEAGINGKMSELHAAMGLCILDDLPMLVNNRQKSVDRYSQAFTDSIALQTANYDVSVPPMYMPVKFSTEQQLLTAMAELGSQGFDSRRYFYPKNHKFIHQEPVSLLPICEQTSNKILCLPLMHNLHNKHIKAIAQTVNKVCQNQNS